MKALYSIILAFMIFVLSGISLAQCASGGSGTSCNGALTVAPPAGNTTQSAIVLTDLGSGTSAPAPATGNYILSIVSGTIQESDNNGVYHPLIGPIGPAGPQGPAGPTGPAGTTGAQGPAGPVGATGPQGLAGATGAPGAAAAVTIGSTTTAASGTPASVTNVGTSSAAVFNFSIPAGPAGPTGPQGPAGVAGAAGATGPPGPAGPTGPTGQGVPAGGNAGARLVKTSSVDFSTAWANAFLDVQGPAPAVTTVAGTPAVLFQYTLPANSMTENSVLRIYAAYRHSSGKDAITYKLTIGNAAITLGSTAVTTEAYQEVLVANMGSLSSQTYFRGPAYSGGAVAALTGTFNVDTSVDEVIQLTATTSSSSTDQVTPSFFAVEVQ